METAMLVALAGGLGSVVRLLVGRALDRGWHLGTLLVNLVGSAVLGGLVGSEALGDLPPLVLTVLGVGLCGGLTTYSAFAVQAAGLAREHRWPRAAAYVLATVGGSLLAAGIGWGVARALLGTP